MIEAALSYLRRGYSVIPCEPNGKRSMVVWGDYQQRHPTEDEVREWFRHSANIAIVTGQISGLTVLDVDGQDGLASLREAKAVVSASRVIRTPKGWHVYYAYTPSVHTKAGALPHVDIRNDGGYVVAPPSATENGAYAVFRDHPIAPMADEMVAALRPGERVNGRRCGDDPWVVRLLEEGAGEGQRNDSAARLAGYLVGKGIPDDVVEAVLKVFAIRCTPPLSAGEVAQVVRSVSRYGDHDMHHDNRDTLSRSAFNPGVIRMPRR